MQNIILFVKLYIRINKIFPAFRKLYEINTIVLKDKKISKIAAFLSYDEFVNYILNYNCSFTSSFPRKYLNSNLGNQISTEIPYFVLFCFNNYNLPLKTVLLKASVIDEIQIEIQR